MKVHVIGIGGVGGYYGGLLAKAGADVTLVSRPGKATAWAQEGLRLDDQGDTYTIENVNVVDSYTCLSASDLIIIAVKTYHLAALAEAIAPHVNNDCIILTLQNGVTADLNVKQRIPQATCLAGITWVLATLIAPGQIQQTNHRTFIRFGHREDPNHPTVSLVQTVLDQYGVQAQVSTDIVADLWEKYIWLSNFAGMTGSRQATIGEVLNNPEDFALWLQGVDEVIALARALKIYVDPATRENIHAKLEKFKTVDTDIIPSLTKDVLQGKQTEIEALSGSVIQMARECNIEVPVHESMYQAIVQATR